MPRLSTLNIENLLAIAFFQSSDCVEQSSEPCPRSQNLQEFLKWDAGDIPFENLYQTRALSINCKKQDEPCQASLTLRELTLIAAREFVDGRRL